MLKLLVSEPCVRRCRHIETQSNHALTGAYVSNRSTNGGVRQQCVCKIALQKSIFFKAIFNRYLSLWSSG